MENVAAARTTAATLKSLCQNHQSLDWTTATWWLCTAAEAEVVLAPTPMPTTTAINATARRQLNLRMTCLSLANPDPNVLVYGGTAYAHPAEPVLLT